MKLEKQVCSLELAKKLKELGMPQESLFYWEDEHQNRLSDGSLDTVPTKIVSEAFYRGTSPRDRSTSTYTVAELGEFLPVKVEDMYHEIVTSHQGTGNWICAVKNIVSGKYTESEEAHTEADARAKMLIYLHENSLLN